MLVLIDSQHILIFIVSGANAADCHRLVLNTNGIRNEIVIS